MAGCFVYYDLQVNKPVIDRMFWLHPKYNRKARVAFVNVLAFITLYSLHTLTQLHSADSECRMDTWHKASHRWAPHSRCVLVVMERESTSRAKG